MVNIGNTLAMPQPQEAFASAQQVIGAGGAADPTFGHVRTLVWGSLVIGSVTTTRERSAVGRRPVYLTDLLILCNGVLQTACRSGKVAA